MGDTVIITGAGSGLGRAVAQRLSAGGSAIAVIDRDVAGADETVRLLKDAGANAAGAYEADVSGWTSVDDAVRQIVADMGPPTALVNAAAIQRFAHSHELDPNDWSRIVAVNLTGTYFMCRAVLPHLMAAGGGAIVNIASTAGLAGLPYDAAYCAAKGHPNASLGLTDTRGEWGGGIIEVTRKLPLKKMLNRKTRKLRVVGTRTLSYPNAIQTQQPQHVTTGKTKVEMRLNFKRVK